MAAVRVGASGEVVIPKKLQGRLGLVPGDYLEIEVRDSQLILTPKTALEKRLAQGLEDIKKGRVLGPFKTAKEALRALKSRAR